jgi:hypothetical protein
MIPVCGLLWIRSDFSGMPWSADGLKLSALQGIYRFL